jgi:hypothetical protein
LYAEMHCADRSAVDAADHGTCGGATNGAKARRDGSREGTGDKTAGGTCAATEDGAVERLPRDVVETKASRDFVKVSIVDRFDAGCIGHAHSSCSADAMHE